MNDGPNTSNTQWLIDNVRLVVHTSDAIGVTSSAMIEELPTPVTDVVEHENGEAESLVAQRTSLLGLGGLTAIDYLSHWHRDEAGNDNVELSAPARNSPLGDEGYNPAGFQPTQANDEQPSESARDDFTKWEWQEHTDLLFTISGSAIESKLIYTS